MTKVTATVTGVILLIFGTATNAANALPFVPSPGLEGYYGAEVNAVIRVGEQRQSFFPIVDEHKTPVNPVPNSQEGASQKLSDSYDNVVTGTSGSGSLSVRTDLVTGGFNFSSAINVEPFVPSQRPYTDNVSTIYSGTIKDILYIFNEGLLQIPPPGTEDFEVEFFVEIDEAQTDLSQLHRCLGCPMATVFWVTPFQHEVFRQPNRRQTMIAIPRDDKSVESALISFRAPLIQLRVDAYMNMSGGTDLPRSEYMKTGWNQELSYASNVRVKIPEGYTCISESGSFLGCDEGVPPEPELPDIAISNVEVTQAVFGSNKLAKGRKTVVFADVELLEGEVSEPVLIGAQFEDELAVTKEISLDSKKIVKDVKIELMPKLKGTDRILLVKADFFGEIKESNENNNYEKKPFNVLKTNLIFPYVFNVQPGCASDPNPCIDAKNNFFNLVEESNHLIWELFPLSNTQNPMFGGAIGVGDSFPIVGKDNIVSITKPTVCGEKTFSKGVWDDLLRLDNDRGSSKRIVGVVPNSYFAFHKLPGVLGVWFPSIKTSVLSVVGSTETPAHELMHTFGADEGYKDCGKTPSGQEVRGYNVNTNMFVVGAYDLMDKENKKGQRIWINQMNWDLAAKGLSKITPDPELLHISALLAEDGIHELKSWTILDGTPDDIEPGDYSVEFYDATRNIIDTIPFQTGFMAHIEPFGTLSVPFAPISFNVLFPELTTEIIIRDSEEQVLFVVEPLIKLINDSIIELDSAPGPCFIDKNSLIAKLNALSLEYQEYYIDRKFMAAGNAAVEMRSEAEHGLIDDCNTRPALTKDKVLKILDSIERRLNSIADPIESILGDLDSDSDVDRDDLNIILVARNTPASGPNDPRDLDGDSMITALDARKLTQLCTRPRCATE